MSAVDHATMRAMIARQTIDWNAGDKVAWLAGMADVVPGEISLRNPAGTHVQHGMEALAAAWDAAPNEAWERTVEQLFTCGTEIALVVRNDRRGSGEPRSVVTIENWQFHGDGTTDVYSYFDQSDDAGTDVAG